LTVSQVEVFSDDSPGNAPVRGFLHRPIVASGDALVLTHGAGGNSQSELLVALATALATKGIAVLRCDLPFRQARPKGPPSPANAKQDQEGLRRAVTLMRQRFPGRVYLGGQSYGGRQATLLAASAPAVTEGLLLLSYPLHPPGRHAQMRTAHFPDLRTPCLFVHGTNDAFATSDELQSAVKLISAPVKLIEIEDAGHGLITKKNREALISKIVEEFTAFTAT
jgi:predicted alpha/beta-hydrolase family hydrolase